MCKWCSKPCRNDCQGRDSYSSGRLVPTKVRVFKRYTENDTSTSQGGDLTWVPLKLNTGGMSILVYDQLEYLHPTTYHAASRTKKELVKAWYQKM
jgi:hypothetical protein